MPDKPVNGARHRRRIDFLFPPSERPLSDTLVQEGNGIALRSYVITAMAAVCNARG